MIFILEQKEFGTMCTDLLFTISEFLVGDDLIKLIWMSIEMKNLPLFRHLVNLYIKTDNNTLVMDNILDKCIETDLYEFVEFLSTCKKYNTVNFGNCKTVKMCELLNNVHIDEKNDIIPLYSLLNSIENAKENHDVLKWIVMKIFHLHPNYSHILYYFFIRNGNLLDNIFTSSEIKLFIETILLYYSSDEVVFWCLNKLKMLGYETKNREMYDRYMIIKRFKHTKEEKFDEIIKMLK